ncbi:MAG TPA: carbohydrate ABC transporter permease [Halanaerobiales bacterium]|nr:carbohydrate ABC transporter permease [Halanaerobiales bacterium]HPZ63473.1 carbohydrate ABC transporter permease [Halanaerobiales bacterium]HQD04351.1 carbohydrate ABC transporter permease [Halanaerobiales bacterium]
MKTKQKRIFKYVFLIIFTLLMLYPVFWLFLGSVKANHEIFAPGKILPSQWMWSNYSKGWNALPGYSFGNFFINSFKISFLIVIGSVFSTSLAAYAFARLEFPLKNFLFTVLMATLMLPQQVLLVLRYVLYSKLGWVNSYKALTVPAFAAQFSGAFFIYLLVQFIRGIPRELDEAAVVDGCSQFRIFWNIIMPNCKPAIFSVALFAFMWSWDDFLNQLLYINDVGKYTISLGLRLFLDNAAAVSWGSLFAMSILSLIPIVTIFFLAQRFFVEGIATTGVKG